MSPSDLDDSPYKCLAVVGIGMTRYVLKLAEDRVVKVHKVCSLDQYTGDGQSTVKYVNEINREALQSERSIYERLGSHMGIIHCFKAIGYGIEPAFAHQGELETYIEANPEPHQSLRSR